MLSTVRLRCAYGEAGVWPRGQPGRSCLQHADTSSAGPNCPSARVLHGLGAWAKPGATRQTQEGVAGSPDFDPDFAEESGLIEPYLSAIPPCPVSSIPSGIQALQTSFFYRRTAGERANVAAFDETTTR